MTSAVEVIHRDVSFEESSDPECSSERTQEKKRNLTMKYGQAQRILIRKRLRVETWLDGELNRLYEITDPNDTYPCDPDLDEIMEIKSDEEKRNTIKELLVACKQTEEAKEEFIDQLLEKIKTLT